MIVVLIGSADMVQVRVLVKCHMQNVTVPRWLRPFYVIKFTSVVTICKI